MAADPTRSTVHFVFLLSLLALSAGAALAQVPGRDTFRFVNEGEFGEYMTEYGAWYRTTPLFGSPFQLMWYNTTPGQYYLALRMGLRRSESLFRWVWYANRGRPVGENATLSFRTDGDLVLAEADGTVAWSTGTSNKGVVGIKIIPGVGNIVLYDKNGKFVWQSFDYPSDTLLPGQSLRFGGRSTLVSRKSDADNSDGTYTFALTPKGFAMSMAAPTSRKPVTYYQQTFSDATIKAMAFTVNPQDPDTRTYSMSLTFSAKYPGLSDVRDRRIGLGRMYYNVTLSFLRLQMDGNLVVYTYYEPVDSEAWERTFDAFSDRGLFDNGYRLPCGLPSKCGALGVCEDGACVACPAPKGLLGWSRSCAPPKRVGACRPGAKADYYKVAGVDHFVPRYTDGLKHVKVGDCMKKCDMDCSCLGFFYWPEASRCWLAPVLGTLTRSSNATHLAYIKSS